jgi:hypothetical protein
MCVDPVEQTCLHGAYSVQKLGQQKKKNSMPLLV